MVLILLLILAIIVKILVITSNFIKNIHREALWASKEIFSLIKG
jgi:hypothetical protein